MRLYATHKNKLKVSVLQSMQVYCGTKNTFLVFIRVVTYKACMHSDILALSAVVSREHTAQFSNTRQTYSGANMTLLLILSTDKVGMLKNLIKSPPCMQLQIQMKKEMNEYADL